LKNEQVIGDTSGNQPEAEYCFEIKINDNVNREKLDVVLRLHDALKKERNNCNHASDKGPRVPSEDVKKLICSYVDLCEQLLEESGCSPLHTKA
jgi:hypothetical protein